MEIYLKAVSGVLIGLIIFLILGKWGKDYSILLILAVCCLIITAAFSYLKPVFELVDHLVSLGQLNTQLLTILLKSAGITVICEVSALLCADAGASAMAKGLHILASSVILWLSIPLFNRLIDLIDTVLSNL